MNELQKFANKLQNILEQGEINIDRARQIVLELNNFLYATSADLGMTTALGQQLQYFSQFHKYWEKHHREILNCKIDDKKCEEVADALHVVYVTTKGKAFKDIYDTCNLTKEQVCQVRMLTANQDFRGSRSFADLAAKYQADPAIFDINNIIEDPREYLKSLGFTSLSQNDKRESYAQNIAHFIKDKNCTPFDILQVFHNNVYDVRTALINCVGAGYGNKKADMFIRDMVVLGIWNNVIDFDKINVASDVNTIKVALRTGIIKTEIPLVSSFLDIFCHQYAYIDDMNALAWRRVWEIWSQKYPNEKLSSPCLIDYFVYKVVGIQFCKETLNIFQCDKYKHIFPWHTGQNRTCQICYNESKTRNFAHVIEKLMPCSSQQGSVAILNTAYVRALPEKEKIQQCPFANICGNKRNLMPPKSISIFGQTGWQTAYAGINQGGGGLMA